jgi:hypothetical protein
MTAASVSATPEQLRVLRHMLGIDKRERCEPYRDHYCANEGDEELAEMARAGLVRLARRPTPGLPYDTYVTTPRGREAAIESQRAMRLSPAQQRYHDFLNMRDACPDLTFREFLTTRGSAPRSEAP